MPLLHQIKYVSHMSISSSSIQGHFGNQNVRTSTAACLFASQYMYLCNKSINYVKTLYWASDIASQSPFLITQTVLAMSVTFGNLICSSYKCRYNLHVGCQTCTARYNICVTVPAMCVKYCAYCFLVDELALSGYFVCFRLCELILMPKWVQA